MACKRGGFTARTVNKWKRYTPARTSIAAILKVAEQTGAKQYRAQIARDAQVQDVIAEATFKENRLRFEGLLTAIIIRVSAIDQHGLEGVPLVQAFTMKAYPEPPFIVEPKVTRSSDDAFCLDRGANYPRPTICKWHAMPTLNKSSAMLKISLGVDYTLDNLADTTYYWRVATQTVQAGKSEQGHYSDIQSFNKLPAQAQAALSDGEDNQISLNWAGEAGQRFFFTTAHDAEFKRLYLEREVNQARIKPS